MGAVHFAAIVLAHLLQPVALFPISRDIFRLFDGKATRSRAAITSTAVYRLACTESACCYRFVRAIKPAPSQSAV
jgi:hypothetical protein